MNADKTKGKKSSVVNEPVSCEQPSSAKVPALVGIETMPGIELKDPIFLPSLLPCCAQLALPFMAKIIGDVRNCTPAEVMIEVAVSLLDGSGTRLADYSDVLALEADEKGRFEVKLIELPDEVAGYRITVAKFDE